MRRLLLALPFILTCASTGPTAHVASWDRSTGYFIVCSPGDIKAKADEFCPSHPPAEGCDTRSDGVACCSFTCPAWGGTSQCLGVFGASIRLCTKAESVARLPP